MKITTKFFKKMIEKRKEKNSQYECEYGKRFDVSSHIIFTKARKKKKEAKKIYKKNKKKYFSLVYDINCTKLELSLICRELYKFRNYDDEISNKSKLESEMNKKIKRLNSLQEELSGSVKENLDKYGWLLRKPYKFKSQKFYRWDEDEFMSKYHFDENAENMYEEFEDEEEKDIVKNDKRSKYNIDPKSLREIEALYDTKGGSYLKKEEEENSHNFNFEPVADNHSSFSRINQDIQKSDEKLDDEKINMLIEESTNKIKSLLDQALIEVVLLGSKTGYMGEERVLNNINGILKEYDTKFTQLNDAIKSGVNLTEEEIFDSFEKVLK